VAHPAGMLCMSRFVPDKTVKPMYMVGEGETSGREAGLGHVQVSRECTTAWMQEVEQCMEQLPRKPEATYRPDQLIKISLF